MQKNDKVVLEIVDMTADGSGVAKYDGIAVFVPCTAIGDKIEALILKVKKTYAFGKVLNIIEPSSNRIEPDCKTFSKCGGCVYRHISYDAECKIKENKAYEAIKRIGGIDLKPQSIIRGENINCYRNKAQLPLDSFGNAGFYAKHSHRIIPNNNCLLQPTVFGEIIRETESFIKEKKISIYNEETHKGLLRHIYLRQGDKTGEISLTLIINGDILPFKDELVTHITANFDQIKSITLNINKQKNNVILGDNCVTLYGDDYINDVLCGVKVRLSPMSFYQVNRTMAERLYLKAKEYACPQNKNILDLYCGAGTIGLSMAKEANSVIGVEIIPEAIVDAKFNARENNIDNARFICGDAETAAKALAKENLSVDTCIVDPPRKGLTVELIKTITKDFCPERVVYVSCDVATLARDIKIFRENGYKLVEYTPCDLFPRTSHVETAALLVRNEN